MNQVKVTLTHAGKSCEFILDASNKKQTIRMNAVPGSPVCYTTTPPNVPLTHKYVFIKVNGVDHLMAEFELDDAHFYSPHTHITHLLNNPEDKEALKYVQYHAGTKRIKFENLPNGHIVLKAKKDGKWIDLMTLEKTP